MGLKRADLKYWSTWPWPENLQQGNFFDNFYVLTSWSSYFKNLTCCRKRFFNTCSRWKVTADTLNQWSSSSSLHGISEIIMIKKKIKCCLHQCRILKYFVSPTCITTRVKWNSPCIYSRWKLITQPVLCIVNLPLNLSVVIVGCGGVLSSRDWSSLPVVALSGHCQYKMILSLHKKMPQLNI